MSLLSSGTTGATAGDEEWGKRGRGGVRFVMSHEVATGEEVVRTRRRREQGDSPYTAGDKFIHFQKHSR